MPYGNFHLRESTVQSILANPKYGPKSELGTNMYTYLKFGLPRVLPPRPHSGSGGAREQVIMAICFSFVFSMIFFEIQFLILTKDWKGSVSVKLPNTLAK